MLVKIIIIIMLFAIFASLGSALYFLLKNHGDPTRIIKALTVRIIISIVLFILLMLAFFFGLITPHGVTS